MINKLCSFLTEMNILGGVLFIVGAIRHGHAENMLNKPVENSNAAFLIKILKDGCDIVNDVWEQDIEKIKVTIMCCNDELSSTMS